MSRTVIPMANNHAVYSVKDVAHLLSLNQSTVYAWLRKGTLPGIKSGRRWAIPKKRLNQWLDAHTVHPTGNTDSTASADYTPSKENPTR